MSLGKTHLDTPPYREFDTDIHRAGLCLISAIRGNLLIAFSDCLARGDTVAQIADRIDLSVETFLHLLYGNDDMSLRTVGTLAYALDTRLNSSLVPTDHS